MTGWYKLLYHCCSVVRFSGPLNRCSEYVSICVRLPWRYSHCSTGCAVGGAPNTPTRPQRRCTMREYQQANPDIQLRQREEEDKSPRPS